MKNLYFVAGLLAMLLTAGCTQQVAQTSNQTSNQTQPSNQTMTQSNPVMLTSDEINWTTAPPSMPAGAQISVIEAGGMKNPEPFMFRLRLPPDYKIAPHTHPAIERVTVISGTFYFGAGDSFDMEKAEAYPAGSVIIMPIGHSMFAFTKDQETIIQISGVGPWGLEYINPADDPRNK